MDQELFKFKNFKIFQGVSHAVIVANNATSFEEMFDNEDGDGKDEDRLIGIFFEIRNPDPDPDPLIILGSKIDLIPLPRSMRVTNYIS